MQMKMAKVQQRFDKKKIRSLLEKEDEFISNLFVNFEVPDSIEGMQKCDKSPINIQFMYYIFSILINIIFISKR